MASHSPILSGSKRRPSLEATTSKPCSLPASVRVRSASASRSPLRVTTEWGKPELLVKNRTFLVLFWDAPRMCPNAPAPIQAAPLASSSSRRFKFLDMMQVSSGRSIGRGRSASARPRRSEEHTSELQSRENLVCRLLLEKKKKKISRIPTVKKKKTNTNKRII